MFTVLGGFERSTAVDGLQFRSLWLPRGQSNPVWNSSVACAARAFSFGQHVAADGVSVPRLNRQLLEFGR